MWTGIREVQVAALDVVELELPGKERKFAPVCLMTGSD